MPIKRIVALALFAAFFFAGCDQGRPPPPKPYGLERRLEIPGLEIQTWAVGPAINLSGHREVDPILQADLLFQELQQVRGMTVVPVDRVVQAYASLNLDRVESAEQAAAVCDLLHVDGLVVPIVTAYDPYAPPKMGASLDLFTRHPVGGKSVELHQSVGMYDSADGTVRSDLQLYAVGRSDPNGPMSDREYFLSMDRYCGFVYHQLIADLLGVAPEQPGSGKSKLQAQVSLDNPF